MCSELYEKSAQNNKIDAAIFEAEDEVMNGAEPIPAKKAKQNLDKNYHGIA